MAKKHHDIKIKRNRSWDDKLLYASTDLILFLLLLVVGYPIVYVLSCSFSSGAAVSSGQVLLWPVDFSLDGYKIVFNYKSVWTGFSNTIFYIGILCNIFRNRFDFIGTIDHRYWISNSF